MSDLSVIRKVDVLQVDSVGLVDLQNTRMLDIRGSGFIDAKDVVINGDSVASFIIASDARIFTPVPTGAESIDTVEVTAHTSGVSEQSTLEIELSPRPKLVSGIDKLIQRVIKVLLTTPGSDGFNPSLGGGLLSLVARNVPNRSDLIASDIAIAIRSAEEQILDSQETSELPVEEQLESISILETSFSIENGIQVKVGVTNALGDTTETEVASNG